jgi:hypothetical protein
MKYRFKFFGIMLCAAALVFTACFGDGSDNDEGGITGYTVGYKETYAVDNVTFVMIYVPGGKTFPIGEYDDEGTATVANAYWIVETEVTYNLWDKVYDWATDTEPWYVRYFASEGTPRQIFK